MRTLFLLTALLLAMPLCAEIQWLKDFQRGFQQAAATGKPIMLDFFAPW